MATKKAAKKTAAKKRGPQRRTRAKAERIIAAAHLAGKNSGAGQPAGEDLAGEDLAGVGDLATVAVYTAVGGEGYDLNDQQFLVWIAAILYAKPGSHSLADALALAKNLVAIAEADAAKDDEENETES